MLEQLIEIATSKAIEVFATQIFGKDLDGKIFTSKRVQHRLIHNKSETRKAIEAHLDMVDHWSQSIDILGMPRPKNLDELYIKLSLTDDPKRFRLGRVKPAIEDFSIDDAIATGNHLLILGDPGCGKTTTQKKIARDLLKSRDHEDGGYLPIVIRCGSPRGGGSTYDYEYQPNYQQAT